MYCIFVHDIGQQPSTGKKVPVIKAKTRTWDCSCLVFSKLFLFLLLRTVHHPSKKREYKRGVQESGPENL